jgi:hypothetical protein
MNDIVDGKAIIELLCEPPAVYARNEAMDLANWICTN